MPKIGVTAVRRWAVINRTETAAAQNLGLPRYEIRKATTAMEILDQEEAGLPEMPRFDDGMVNIGELIHTMAESLVNEIMDAQAEDACAEGNRRNGYRERALATGVGRIRLRIPKLRSGSYSPEDLLTRCSRTDVPAPNPHASRKGRCVHVPQGF